MSDNLQIPVGQIERKTQNRIVQLFQTQLGYDYLGDWQDREGNSNVEDDILRAYLIEKGYSETLITRAIYELNKTAGDQRDLYYVNKDVYTYLRYGIQVKEDVGATHETVWLIDWKEPLNNHFAIAEEVTIKGENDKRPDIVLYVNGIALGVLELKRSTVSVSAGIRQNLDNQQSRFIKQFFSTIQLVMAGNDTEGLRYGTIETKEKYYLTWKEENSDEEKNLDNHLKQICNKERFLEILHDFIVFDRGIKKLCRPNQYFGIKAAQARLRKREGGIIWHTQGSGKSLTMVWLTKWIREHIADARVLIITDRDELDKQIEKVFKGVQEDIYRTKNGDDLIKKLNTTLPSLMCSLIHKFGNKSEANYDAYIEDLEKSLPKDFKAKGDIYVFVDECHRTQSGDLHKAMRKILPNAILVGFTGTPLLKKDKLKSVELFGTYIHTYKFDEAVKDKVVLDLRYEARNIDQNITSPDKVDKWFEAKTRGLTTHAQDELKKKWGTMQKVLSSKSRLEKIVADIRLDMETKDRLQNGRGNALLVSGDIYQACKYYELFQYHGFTKCAIVTSYVPSINDIKGETTGDDSVTEKLRKYEIYQKMLGGKSTEDFEDEVKAKFVDEPAQMKLLIVVDKLLTGFDAPSATYLYIDKTMRDHGLFQAICRVNRLDGDDKEYGYIIDYKDLFKSLEKAVDDYTSDAFEDFDKEDIEGLLSDRLKKGKERLEETLEIVKALCEPVEAPRDTPAYIHYFCSKDTTNVEELKTNEQKRIALYKQTSSLVRAYANLANEMEDAGYTADEAERIKRDVKHFESVRLEIKLASGDHIDLKAYEPAMRHLIDTYISAEESEKISAFDDLSLIQLIVERGADAVKELPKGIRENKEAVAETIENNLRRVIISEQQTNPKYFENMSKLLDELIQARKEQAIEYEKYLKTIVDLTNQVNNPTIGTYPKTLNTSAKRALYDNLEKNEELALALDKAVIESKQDSFRGNRMKEKKIEIAIKNVLKNYGIDNADEVKRVFELVKDQREY